jgi:GTP:adenosylcobinamide-phosphate guanylyltransferase
MELQQLADALNKFGFPIIATGGMGYVIYFVWIWATTIIKPLLSEASDVLINLVDHIRLLDNDVIRLTQKINVAIKYKTYDDDNSD